MHLSSFTRTAMRFSRGYPQASCLAMAGFSLSGRSVLQHKACIKHALVFYRWLIQEAGLFQERHRRWPYLRQLKNNSAKQVNNSLQAMAEHKTPASSRMQISLNWTPLCMCPSWHSPFKHLHNKHNSYIGNLQLEGMSMLCANNLCCSEVATQQDCL